jgi:hypothetical protein
MKRHLVAVLAAVVLGAWTHAPIAYAQPAPDEAQDPAATTQPGLVVRAFGSILWSATEAAHTPNSFGIGQFDLFATSALNERVSVLAEVVFEASSTNTRVVTDVERLQLNYRVNDSLHLSVGRYHTGIGFYNAAFHHGSYFETPIGRPRVMAFEDEGGVLPVHDVGITVRGAVPGSASQLHYVAEIGNGRDWTETEDVSPGDENSAKAINVGLSYRPRQWSDVELGVSQYYDRVPHPVGEVAYRTTAAFVAWRTSSLEVLGEWIRLAHRRQTEATVANNAGYLQLSRAWGHVRPYYRYDRVQIAPGTPLIGEIESYAGHLLGLRIDPAAWVGVKVQYQRARLGTHRGVDSVVSELVFVF